MIRAALRMPGSRSVLSQASSPEPDGVERGRRRAEWGGWGARQKGVGVGRGKRGAELTCHSVNVRPSAASAALAWLAFTVRFVLPPPLPPPPFAPPDGAASDVSLATPAAPDSAAAVATA